jgi:Tol biopolymer transport system component
VLAVYAVISIVRPRTRPFETTRMSKITTNGTAIRAVVSPDGQHVAYVSNERGKPVLWLRKIDSPETRRLAGPMDGDIDSLNFTNNGSDVCFLSSSRNDPDRGVLYLVPVSGGVPRKLTADVSTPVAPSMDGMRLAFLRRNTEAHTDDLYIAHLDGGDQRKIVSRHYPERFAWASLPAWSPDGKRVAIGVEGTDNQGFYVYLMIVRVADGSTQIIRNPRWQYVERIAWLDRGRGLVVIGQESESSFQHIWYIPYPKGDPKQINNDLSDYVGVSLTADGCALVSVQYQTLANLYISRRDSPGEGVQITRGLGRYFDLSWAIDGKIVYASDASSSADIWMMNANGSGQQQLTAHSARNYAPSVSPDGNWIVFHSNRSGNWNVWRMGSNGAGPTALTADKHDSNWPRFTPDGRYVVYHHTGTNGWNIWQVPLAGGAPVQLTTAPSTHPAVSPKDGRIACWYSQDVAKPSWKLAVLPATGGAPLRSFDLPSTAVADSALQWTPSGDGITFLDGRNGASNLWIQPVDGGNPRPLTAFPSGQIYSFDWSRDGRLVYSRGISSSDIVLIQDTARK